MNWRKALRVAFKGDLVRFREGLEQIHEMHMDFLMRFSYADDICESHGEVEDVFV